MNFITTASKVFTLRDFLEQCLCYQLVIFCQQISQDLDLFSGLAINGFKSI